MTQQDPSRTSEPTEPTALWLALLGAGSALVFVTLTTSVARHMGPLTSTDFQLHLWVLAHRNDVTIGMARWLTWGGATVVTLPALVVIGALASPSRLSLASRIGAGVALTCVAGLGVYVGLAINAAVGGVRPLVSDWAGTAGGPSFPSGHTTAATIFAASVVWALVPRLQEPWQRVVLLVGAAAYAFIVGVTRVWLGVHWPSDVMGGWLFGVAWASLAAAAVIAIRRRSRRGVSHAPARARTASLR